MNAQKQRKEGMPFIKYLTCAKHVAGHSIISMDKSIKMDISITFIGTES